MFHSSKKEENGSLRRRSPRTDFHIPHSKWAQSVVGVCSEIDTELDSNAILEEELEWAAHLGLSAILLPKIASYLGPEQTSSSSRGHLTCQAASLCAKYSTRIAGALQRLGDDAPSVWLPLLFSWESESEGGRERMLGEEINNAASVNTTINTWDVWNAARTLLDQNPLVQLALELPVFLSPLSLRTSLDRWLGEPVRCLLIPTSTFVLNRSGFPVLPRLHQRCVLEFHRAQAHIIVIESNNNTVTSTSSSSSSTINTNKQIHTRDVYCTYLKHLLSTSNDGLEEDEEEEKHKMSTDMFSVEDSDELQLTSSTRLEQDRKDFEAPWHDFLQVPLQPLASNLSSSVYEVFEKDPVKYIAYERAVFSALSSLIDRWQQQSESGINTTVPECILIAVVGAGRGPLVSSILRAADDQKIPRNKLHVFAIEKNRNAVITLQTVLNSHEQQLHKHEQQRSGSVDTASDSIERGSWAGRVTILQADIRSLVSSPVPQRPEPFNRLAQRPLHIIVSELLGSFGDNELSPECLDAAQQLLVQRGVMIPFRSTSFLTPISSQRLWSEVRKTQAIAGATGGSGASGGLFASSKWFETPLVVSMANVHVFAEHPLPVFSFTHPSASTEDELLAAMASRNEDRNSREVTLRFLPLSSPTLLHGFAGYFTADLTDDITLSIHPDPSLRTKGLFSWFPIFFPLRDPIMCSSGDEIEVKMWRKCSSSRSSSSDVETGTVWYEWAVTSPSVSHIHNAGGRSSLINL